MTALAPGCICKYSDLAKDEEIVLKDGDHFFLGGYAMVFSLRPYAREIRAIKAAENLSTKEKEATTPSETHTENKSVFSKQVAPEPPTQTSRALEKKASLTHDIPTNTTLNSRESSQQDPLDVSVWSQASLAPTELNSSMQLDVSVDNLIPITTSGKITSNEPRIAEQKTKEIRPTPEPTIPAVPRKLIKPNHVEAPTKPLLSTITEENTPTTAHVHEKEEVLPHSDKKDGSSHTSPSSRSKISSTSQKEDVQHMDIIDIPSRSSSLEIVVAEFLSQMTASQLSDSQSSLASDRNYHLNYAISHISDDTTSTPLAMEAETGFSDSEMGSSATDSEDETEESSVASLSQLSALSSRQRDNSTSNTVAGTHSSADEKSSKTIRPRSDLDAPTAAAIQIRAAIAEQSILTRAKSQQQKRKETKQERAEKKKQLALSSGILARYIRDNDVDWYILFVDCSKGAGSEEIDDIQAKIDEARNLKASLKNVSIKQFFKSPEAAHLTLYFANKLLKSGKVTPEDLKKAMVKTRIRIGSVQKTLKNASDYHAKTAAPNVSKTQEYPRRGRPKTVETTTTTTKKSRRLASVTEVPCKQTRLKGVNRAKKTNRSSESVHREAISSGDEPYEPVKRKRVSRFTADSGSGPIAPKTTEDSERDLKEHYSADFHDNSEQDAAEEQKQKISSNGAGASTSDPNEPKRLPVYVKPGAGSKRVSLKESKSLLEQNESYFEKVDPGLLPTLPSTIVQVDDSENLIESHTSAPLEATRSQRPQRSAKAWQDAFKHRRNVPTGTRSSKTSRNGVVGQKSDQSGVEVVDLVKEEEVSKESIPPELQNTRYERMTAKEAQYFAEKHGKPSRPPRKVLEPLKPVPLATDNAVADENDQNKQEERPKAVIVRKMSSGNAKDDKFGAKELETKKREEQEAEMAQQEKMKKEEAKKRAQVGGNGEKQRGAMLAKVAEYMKQKDTGGVARKSRADRAEERKECEAELAAKEKKRLEMAASRRRREDGTHEIETSHLPMADASVPPSSSASKNTETAPRSRKEKQNHELLTSAAYQFQKSQKRSETAPVSRRTPQTTPISSPMHSPKPSTPISLPSPKSPTRETGQKANPKKRAAPNAESLPTAPKTKKSAKGSLSPSFDFVENY